MMKKSNGVGKYQIEKAEKSLSPILKILSDGKKHRYKEIKGITGLNDPTMTKYLKRLSELKIIEKTVDIESGVYPHPVNYRTAPAFATQLKIILRIEKEKETVANEFK